MSTINRKASTYRYLRPLGVLAGVASLLLIVITAITWVPVSESSTASVIGPQARPIDRKPVPAPPNLKAETLAFDGAGFTPGKLSRETGEFLLGIDDQSQLPAPVFELVREGDKEATSVLEIRAPKKVTRLRKLVNLPPGDYLLKEVTEGKWACRITITK